MTAVATLNRSRFRPAPVLGLAPGDRTRIGMDVLEPELWNLQTPDIGMAGVTIILSPSVFKDAVDDKVLVIYRAGPRKGELDLLHYSATTGFREVVSGKTVVRARVDLIGTVVELHRYMTAEQRAAHQVRMEVAA